MLRGVACSIRIRIGVDHAVKPCSLRNGARRREHTRRGEQRESHESGTGDWLQSDILVRGRAVRRARSAVDADIIVPRSSLRCLDLAYFRSRSQAWRVQADCGVGAPERGAAMAARKSRSKTKGDRPSTVAAYLASLT